MKKKIHIPDVDCSVKEYHDILAEYYPKLKNCGGFELLRGIPNTRDLEIVPPPICHSPRLLRNHIGGGRIYIHPIQMDLDIEETIEEIDSDVYMLAREIMNK